MGLVAESDEWRCSSWLVEQIDGTSLAAVKLWRGGTEADDSASNVPLCDDNLGKHPFSLSCFICHRLLNTGLYLGLVCLLDGRHGGYSASTLPRACRAGLGDGVELVSEQRTMDTDPVTKPNPVW